MALTQGLFPEKRCSEFLKEQLDEKDYFYDKCRHSDYKKYYNLIKRNECYKEWSVLVYMAGDNNLSNYAKADIFEMEAVGSRPEMDIIVEADFRDELGSRRFHIQKNPAPYKKHDEEFFVKRSPEASYSPIVETLPELDSGNIKTLDNFLTFAAIKYPAKHYMGDYLESWSGLVCQCPR